MELIESKFGDVFYLENKLIETVYFYVMSKLMPWWPILILF